MVNYIEKAEAKEDKKILFDEFRKLILQGKITFTYLYCDREENRLRGRVRSSSGFRNGTQRLDLVPDNKYPKTRSPNTTALRYWDFGRSGWRSFRKDHFVVATSFWDAENNEWKDNPYDAGFVSDWRKIRYLNRLSKYVQSDRPDTPQEIAKRLSVAKKEREKRKRQIQRTRERARK